MKTHLITEAELATWLNISKSTLHKLREEGELPFRLIGTCIRYSPPEIEAWLANKSVNTTERNKGEDVGANSTNASTTQIQVSQP